MHASVLQKQNVVNPVCHTPWFSNKRPCLQRRRFGDVKNAVRCATVLTPDQADPPGRGSSRVRAAPDTLVSDTKLIQQQPTSSRRQQTPVEQPKFDWHDQWYAVGYERFVRALYTVFLPAEPKIH